MKKKLALIITTVSGFVPQFEMNNVKILQELGYEVHYASNFKMPVYGTDNKRLDGTGIVRHQIDFARSPFRLQNLKAYRQLMIVIKKEKFALVHCHTPMGGVIGRLVAKRTGTKPVLYTAHGFHFFKGASIASWLFFYPVERYLARYTDVLLTINQEDYKNAKKFKLRKGGLVDKINGIGMDIEKNKSVFVDVCEKRKSIGIEKDDFLLLSVGELTKRKNHKVVIQALAELKNPQIKYVICGTGVLEEELQKLIVQLGLEKQVFLVGYRTDIIELLKISDCFVFPSLQEGLPVALMEAMTVGLPVICSNIRGNIDLIKDKQGGYLVESTNVKEYKQAIQRMYQNSERTKMGIVNEKRIEKFSLEKVDKKMRRIYEKSTSVNVDL